MGLVLYDGETGLPFGTKLVATPWAALPPKLSSGAVCDDEGLGGAMQAHDVNTWRDAVALMDGGDDPGALNVQFLQGGVKATRHDRRSGCLAF